MAAKKMKAKRAGTAGAAKPKADRSAEGGKGAAPAFTAGDRVKVLAGDWGNALGTVVDILGKLGVGVRLDAHAHEPDRVTSFSHDELRASNAADLAR